MAFKRFQARFKRDLSENEQKKNFKLLNFKDLRVLNLKLIKDIYLSLQKMEK